MKDNVPIVGFMGKAGSGKDTAADILVGFYGYRKDSLALPIKRGLSAMLDLSIDAMNDRSSRELPFGPLSKSIREMLQTLGTDWGRNMVHEDIWVMLALDRYRKHGPTVFADVRFDNEVRAIQQCGGLVCLVRRPEDQLELIPDHASERVPESMADFWVHNDGTIDDFKSNVISAFSAMRR